MRQTVLLVLLSFLFGTISGQPRIYPNIREWTGEEGYFKLKEKSSRICYMDNMALLERDLLQFQDDLNTVSGKMLDLAQDDPAIGDISFSLSPELDTLSEEAYVLEIGNSITVKAASAKGMFYGMQTLLQIFKQDDKVARGKAVDYPLFQTRGFMIDVARDYFEIEYLESVIRKLAWMKLNYIHVHFTDAEAFRLKSDLFPGLAHPTEHYTKEDIRRLQDYAARFHVMLIPEIEMPAHAASYSDYNPYLGFDCASMRVGHKVTEGFEESEQADWGFTVDITRREVRTWLKALLDEWIPLFDAPYFHIGGDEWQYDVNKYACPELMEATRRAGFEYPGDIFVDFVNEMNELVKSHGKTTHIWNWWRFSPDKDTESEVRMNRTSIQPDKDIVVHVWNQPRQKEILNDGYNVIITSEEGPEALYCTPYDGNGQPGDYGVFHTQRIYEEWIPKQDQNILGYKVCLWTDTNDGRPDEWYDPYYELPIAILAEKTWAKRMEVSLQDFKEKVNSIGMNPGD